MVGLKRRRIRDDILFISVNTVFLVVFLSLMLYPFIVTISTSFSVSKRLVAQGSVYLLPAGLSLKAYSVLLMVPDLLRFYLNTVIYSVGGTVAMLIVSCLTAYPLTLKKMPGRRFVTVLFTLTLFFSGGLIAYYIWMRRIGMANNVWAMTIPYGINVWNIIIFKTFFQQLPIDLSESAYLDGANEVTILFRLILPLSKPILATFAVFGLVSIWNDWFYPAIFLDNPILQPMQLVLRKMLIMLDTSLITRSSTVTGYLQDFVDARPVRAAAVVITVLPIACIYPFFQKYFTKGILVGSLKG